MDANHNMEHDKVKLRLLLEYWVGYTRQHKEILRKNIKEVHALGLNDAAKHLAKAVDAMDESTKQLQKTLNCIGDDEKQQQKNNKK